MSGGVHSLRLDTLPEALPIFPLTGVVLLPHGRLPLNIFEPRYLNMIEDTLGGDRMIGMVQPVHGDSDPVGDDAEVYRTGCAGRITSFTETDDGRFVITLTGVSRFHMVGELEPARGYRRATVNYDAFADDLGEGGETIVDRPRLLNAMRAYFALREIEADWGTVEEAAGAAIIISLAMICPFEPSEKQALLESPTPGERAELLATLMEMAIRDAAGSSVGRVH
jgi:uncharacterized protein